MPYRGVVRHIRYWRGAQHSWTTVYPFIGTATRALTATDAQTLLQADAKMCFGNGTVGGAYECEIYDQASGGVPVATYVAFDHTVPASWPGYPTTVWPVTPTKNYVAEAETAVQVEWPVGFSSSGKPVQLRKWYHSVGTETGGTGSTPDLDTPTITALQTQAQVITGCLGSAGITLGSYRGIFAGTPTVKAFFGNHQMPRGRRRKKVVIDGREYIGPIVTVGPDD